MSRRHEIEQGVLTATYVEREINTSRAELISSRFQNTPAELAIGLYRLIDPRSKISKCSECSLECVCEPKYMGPTGGKVTLDSGEEKLS